MFPWLSDRNCWDWACDFLCADFLVVYFQQISAHDLKKYKLMENAAKGKDKSDLTNKFNSLGVTFKELEKRKFEEQSALDRMRSDIDNLLKTDTRDGK